MKHFLGLSLFLILDATAADIGLGGCGIYAFKGKPKIIDKEMVLMINEGSRSEMVLKIARSEEMKIAPYLKLMTSGDLHIGKLTGPKTGVIDRLSNLDYATPDPLNTIHNSFLRSIKKEKCP